jgi:hypothetical protein
MMRNCGISMSFSFSCCNKTQRYIIGCVQVISRRQSTIRDRILSSVYVFTISGIFHPCL